VLVVGTLERRRSEASNRRWLDLGGPSTQALCHLDICSQALDRLGKYEMSMHLPRRGAPQSSADDEWPRTPMGVLCEQRSKKA
jgi:hypothetical protein